MSMDLQELRALNSSAAFNRWCGIEVERCALGMVQLVLPWRSEFARASGHLHSGLVGALIDTAASLAAWTLVGSVLASHFSIDILRSHVAEKFILKAKVIRSEGPAVVIACDLFASSNGEDDVHVATSEVTAYVESEAK